MVANSEPTLHPAPPSTPWSWTLTLDHLVMIVYRWRKVGVLLVVLCLLVIQFALYLRCDMDNGNLLRNVETAPERPEMRSQLDHLVMVAGHSVFMNKDWTNDIMSDESWYLVDFQKNQAGVFVNHIRRGVELAAQDPYSMLLFSGGQTRPDAGPRSEAQSYWMVAAYQNWFHKVGVEQKAFTEEYARDSFENLLFSICRFQELTGNYPAKITVVGFEFKKSRFVNQHRAALRYPVEDFFYEGIDPEQPGSNVAGEAQNSAEPFRADPYGCHEPLSAKKSGRNPYHRVPSYPLTCPELSELFAYCGQSIFDGPLPWD
eukprot:NODE_612_length_1328_cov_75.006661_g573_i0.p1 GENE.NODE_612_length_1328_cov_75.006661_g573_i0~~NODE_612_length_1328_cov_75.006661_g573_i0.p1  ORF type:complete len:316 (+),score=35.28 NODE_612_length_1328_cov_75.006661_g573_i0:135-1082(+)